MKALQRAGWELRRPGKGKKHCVLVNPDLPGIVTVPRHPKVKTGTLRSIIKGAGLTVEEFEKLYR